ncbi:MoaD/ThiS family protein [Malikia sp.]|uniref:MoaD/ThiS family protein n=1 Tax=Malikia sp. TaxID=2070706 RepID=UPI002626033D|nr:MoaD/ThiS family protein [Malikia sp.]MDD2728570.1 MoaD/ThiS family protein [Malikia sp.]
MQIELRFFASIREALDLASLSWQTEAASVGALRDELIARGGVWAEALARGRAVRASLDQHMVGDEAALREGAEVAFFPPVTGG